MCIAAKFATESQEIESTTYFNDQFVDQEKYK